MAKKGNNKEIEKNKDKGKGLGKGKSKASKKRPTKKKRVRSILALCDEPTDSDTNFNPD